MKSPYISLQAKLPISAIIVILIVTYLFSIINAHAHKLGESYLVFTDIEDHQIRGKILVTYNDLDKVLELDKNRDGKVTDEEFLPKFEMIRAYLFSRIKLSSGQEEYTLNYQRYEVVKLQMAHFVNFFFTVDNLKEKPEELTIEYSLFFDSIPKHRGFLHFGDDEKPTLIFTPKRNIQQVSLTTSSSRLSVLFSFVKHGIWHIWIGIDHILFLLALVLISVVKRENKRWAPVLSFRPAFINIVKIVTVFTVAHSITLSLAALQLVKLSPRLVESVIAASVIVVGVNNIVPFFSDRIWWIIFGFGLFHGFGFANVLGDLGLQQGSLILALLGFNVGVELGQIAIICVSFPLCFLLRRTKYYPKIVLNVGSAMIAVVALKWFVERAFDITL